MKIKLTIIIISGLLMSLANAPAQWWFLAWFGLTPLWVILVLSNYQGKCIKKIPLIFNQNSLYALLWGLIFYGISLFWITGIHPLTWMGIPWLSSLLITLFCWLFVTFWASIIPVIWAVILNKLTHLQKVKPHQNQFLLSDSIKRVIIAVTIWCVLETIWSYTPLWWPTLALTQSPHNLIILQLGKLSGTTTITALIVAVNGLIAEGIIHLYFKQKKYIFPLITISLLLISHGLGFYFYKMPTEKLDQQWLKVGLIQGNIPPQIKSFSAGFFQAIEGYTKGYKELSQGGAQLILTPETALPFFWKDMRFYSSLLDSILQEKTPIILGAFSEKKMPNNQGYTNSLFSITQTGEILSQYDKIKLVPLGEYIPFQDFLGKLIKRLSAFEISLIPGDKKQILNYFNTPVGKAIIGICYESAFADNFRLQALAGGEFIITASNNSFYLDSMLSQHHGQDILRAIETDRWVARATNTGYSAIVNPQGKTLWLSEINTYQTHLDTIYKRHTKTLYVQWGDWLIWILLIFALMAIISIY
jgi:apolipoprotein N-acyltransferase